MGPPADADLRLLDVRHPRADLSYSRLRFLPVTLTGTPRASQVYRHAEVAGEAEVMLTDGRRRIALDGEVSPFAVLLS